MPTLQPCLHAAGLERVSGIEPPFSAWEADIITIIRHSHGLGGRGKVTYRHYAALAHAINEFFYSVLLCYNYKVSKNKSQKFIFLVFILFFSAFISEKFVYAAETNNAQSENCIFSAKIDKISALNGKKIDALDGAIEFTFFSNTLDSETDVEAQEIKEGMTVPWQIDKISPIFQFEIKNKGSYSGKKPISIAVKYGRASDTLKQIFYYDKISGNWRPLPTEDFPEKLTALAKINLPFARLAVFDNPRILAIGKASWYRYKSGNFAASPDFPKGSIIRVYNTENNKFVDVKINDYGPERNLHPDRVVDLEKNAFAKIASLKKGTAQIKIQPLFIPLNSPAGEGERLGAAGYADSQEPFVSAKSAIVKNERSGEVVFAKNADAVLPLASLTKLVAVKVFLDARPGLDGSVAYSAADEEYNYQYVDNKWESASLKIKDGETLTIKDLVYSALVGSANNAVETLVRASGMEREKFIAKMNETVGGWGALSTHFIEPTGLSPQNVSSASDYAIITKEALKDSVIQKASATKEYKFATINTKKSHWIKNTNPLLLSDSFYVTGSKTGYLNEAGHCLMMRSKSKNGDDLITVIMGAYSKTKILFETEDLFLYGFKKITNN